ncbi:MULTISPECIES: PDR/VanB family oxidoreductase [unclassified Pseudofrankia]|uniref:PDR/VanB family oxidoreductase n=1 Tax=unclassified Pseudofrankia TaxID=2994372 RepID=UPI0008D9C4BF|nr:MULTISPECIES: PDR/VanB family oxidoreductase [unclassified Pseudofrankia]MDT3444426.1 PDR/VanB family oxidoreductase [Pseudofrankia sp. BMG5.37]OHV56450.1 ferredoxin [Pseudofrankia sp. BMG5.36]
MSLGVDLELVVAAVDEPVPGVRSIRLAAPDGRELPGFVPGSHLLLDCGGRVNAYSLTSDGFCPREYAVSVLLVENGFGGSRWIHERLAPDDRVAARLPRSAFPPVARARRHLLVAGGIGVTPIVSHLRAARRRGHDVRVLYTYRAGRGAHADDVVELSDGRAELFTDRRAFSTRVEEALADQPLGTHLYVCGPAALTERVVGTAAALGWPASRIHTERFGTVALDPGDSFDVVLTRTGGTLTVPSGTSLLAALEDAGLDVASRCRQGVCGECRIPVTAGRPLHRDLFLSEEERSTGAWVMPCVSRADGSGLEVPL